MKIRPRNIPKFQNGGVPQWYLDRYGNRTSLLNWNLNKRYNYSNQNLNTNDHRNAGNLDTVYNKNMAYIGTPGAISSDIQAFYNSDGNGMSAQDFVNFYNQNAAKIRNHWAQDQTYNAKTAGDHNRLFKRMFQSRSNQSMSPGSSYNIGYQDNLENIEGSSTWLRRMDQYEKEFDLNNPDSNRIHEITLKDGSKARVYKKANGDIGLIPVEGVKPKSEEIDYNKLNSSKPQLVQNSIIGKEKLDKEPIWDKLKTRFNQVAPDLLEAIRLAGTLHNNNRIFDESKKAIIPNLQQSYHTYRQVVGDEATKQAYYRRAAQGQTQAAKPFTSDADRQIAYQMEAKRVGDELRAQGDLADNQRIRETSAESAAHADANIERDTAVANNNLTEMIKARAAKHQLNAQKYLADWTNIDQFLLGKVARLEQKKAQQKAIQDQVDLLTMQDSIYDDPGYKTAYNNLQTVATKHNNDWNHPEVIAASRALQKAKNQYLINYYKTRIAKSGTKLTYKDNTDKYLYKISKDVVEHFRRMSKLTDDSRIRTLPKPIKLNSAPKKTKKYQLGGVAPFYIYRPYGVGGESVTSTQSAGASGGGSSSGSKKSDSEKDKLDMIKELFKSVKGLPVDVSAVYQSIKGTLDKAKAFGEDLTTDDLASMYLSSMQKMAQLKYSEDSFEKAKAQATSNEALNEYAVGTNGEMVFQNLDTGEYKIGTIKSEMFKDKVWNPLTNDQLLELRAKSPNMAFNDRILSIVNNGVGMNKIAAQIKNLAGNIGSSEQKIEGISQVESNQIKAGLQLLAGAAGTPDGYYKITKESKDSKNQIQAAIQYIKNMLPNNYRIILNIHSNGNEDALITSMLVSQTNTSYKENISPLTGKASDKGEEGDLDNLEINSATQLLLGMSSPREFAFSIGNGNMFNGMARVSSITKDKNPIGADFAYSDIYKSDLHGILDLDNASFGDIPINKALKDRIIIDNSTIAGIDLPYTTDRNGRIIPDFKMLNRIEEADQEILKSGINPEKEPQKVNEIYAKHNLPIKYGSDNRLTGNYKRFAVIQATAIEDVFLDKSGLASNGTLSLVSDEEEINKYINEIKKTTGEKEIDRDRPGLFTGDKDIYKGSIFIPIIGDLVDAVSATGGLKAGNYDELRSKYQTKNYNEAPQFVKQ